MPPIKTIISAKNKRLLIGVSVTILILISLTLISMQGVSHIKKSNNEIAQMEEYEDYGDLYDNYQGYQPHQARLIPKERNIDDFIIAQPISSKPTYSPNVDKVAWEVPESLTKKPNYTRFLQLTGKNIKLNLQNDLLLVNDVPVNKQVSVEIKIRMSGDVDSIRIVQTSGSNAIDDSILKVISDTLKYMKPPSLGIMSKAVKASLTIELR